MKRFFLNFEENLAAGLMGWLLTVLFLQVFTRYVLNDPLSWTEEVARYSYVYIVFLGSSAAITHRTHVGIDFVVKATPRRVQWAVAFAVNLLILFTLANLVYWGYRAALRQWTLPLVVLDVPYTWVYIVVPITAALMTLRTIAVMREDWARMRGGAGVESETRSGL
jgi:TRAP-type C4-dicarboxylate transport system permease small subunit